MPKRIHSTRSWLSWLCRLCVARSAVCLWITCQEFTGQGRSTCCWRIKATTSCTGVENATSLAWISSHLQLSHARLTQPFTQACAFAGFRQRGMDRIVDQRVAEGKSAMRHLGLRCWPSLFVRVVRSASSRSSHICVPPAAPERASRRLYTSCHASTCVQSRTNCWHMTATFWHRCCAQYVC